MEKYNNILEKVKKMLERKEKKTWKRKTVEKPERRTKILKTNFFKCFCPL